MRDFTYQEATQYLELRHSYHDIATDADYTTKEVIELAEQKWEESCHECGFQTRWLWSAERLV